MSSTKFDVESHRDVTDFMDDKTIRHKFVTKVYTILTAQVLYTCALVVAFLNIKDLNDFAKENRYIGFFVCPMVTMALFLAMSCFDSLRRSFPLNFILLLVFTTTVSVEVATLCVFSPLGNVYMACYMTAGLFLFLTALAYLNVFDITSAGQVLCWSSIVLTVLSLGIFSFSFFGFNIKPLFIILLFITLLLVLVYIVYDTQIILGEGKLKLSEEEYILAVILLYVDLIMLFKVILMLLNDFKGSD